MDSEYPDRRAAPWRDHAALRTLLSSIFFTDGPDHARVRRAFSSVFTARRVAKLEPAVVRLIDQRLDRLAELGADGTPVDFMSEFALPLPSDVIGELLGRWIDSPGHIVPVTAAHPGLSGVETIRLMPDASSLQVVTLVPGVKFIANGKKSGHGMGWVPAPEDELPAAPPWDPGAAHKVIAVLDSGVVPHPWLPTGGHPPFLRDADGLDGWCSPIEPANPAQRLVRDLALHEPDVELAGLEHRHVLGAALGVPRLDAQGGIERIDGLGHRLAVDREAAARRGRAEDHDARLGLGAADGQRAQRCGEAASPDADDHGAYRTTGAPRRPRAVAVYRWRHGLLHFLDTFSTTVLTLSADFP